QHGHPKAVKPPSITCRCVGVPQRKPKIWKAGKSLSAGLLALLYGNSAHCPGETPASPAKDSFLALSDIWLTTANQRSGERDRHCSTANRKIFDFQLFVCMSFFSKVTSALRVKQMGGGTTRGAIITWSTAGKPAEPQGPALHAKCPRPTNPNTHDLPPNSVQICGRRRDTMHAEAPFYAEGE
ncbi:hypothetical protein KUCAC02_031440, partial [Chaenocephalus aceratus]